MVIDIDNMKKELSKLNKTLSDYEYTYLNMYNEFSAVSSVWKGNVSQKFSNSVSGYKIKIKVTIDEFKTLLEVYQYIIDSYGKLGKICKYDLNKKDSLLKEIETYKNKINKIYQQYLNLDTSFDSSIKSYVNSEIKIVSGILLKLDTLSNEIRDFYSVVSEINKEAKLKLSKLNIKNMDNIEIRDYL